MLRSRSIKLPPTPFARFRLLFLMLALSGAVFAAAMAAANAATPAERTAGVMLSLALAAYWIRGYRHNRFSLPLEVLEVAAVFAILHVTPGNPLLPVVGLIFRSLYGGPVRAFARYGLWMGALFGAHAGLGHDQFDGDLSRAAGTALAPVLGQSLFAALRASEIIQRRLTSIVQNSTDIVTIVGADLRIRWQAASIRGVLAQDPDALVGTRLHDLVHADDRASLDGYFAEADGKPDHARNLTLRLAHGVDGYRHFDVVAANRLHDPSVDGYVLNMRDATDRRGLESELRSLAAQREHDATARSADRARQPAPPVRAPRGVHDRRPRREDQARAAADRPRPLQGAQRHPRPSGRRPPAARDRTAARGRRARRAARGACRRRRVRRAAAARDHGRRGRGGRGASLPARSKSRSASRA